MADGYENQSPGWDVEGVEPPVEMKTETGFRAGYKPPAGIFNWFWTGVSRCITELQAVFSAHKRDNTNPHAVSKAQVGLGSADNTADASKQVLAARGYNNNGTAGAARYCMHTYTTVKTSDANGNVTLHSAINNQECICVVNGDSASYASQYLMVTHMFVYGGYYYWAVRLQNSAGTVFPNKSVRLCVTRFYPA
ncbi:hypothetical protein LJC49_04435 [Ruminococcaceae bacterium OttesenSCG-928-I18]|nr:hypothetical protein [Ruminococcaceae bacterium OttesenSCG-928-I18]